MVCVVDRADRVVGFRDRSELVDGVDRWRIVVLVVVSSDGRRMLLARRADGKEHDPCRWAPLVVGTVAGLDSYDDTIVREVFEETGLRLEIDALDRIYAGSLDVSDQLRNVVVYGWVADVDVGSLVLDPAEADEVAWFDVDELAAGSVAVDVVESLTFGAVLVRDWWAQRSVAGGFNELGMRV